MGAKLCPACLSSVGADAAHCPECGTALQRRRSRRAWPWVLAVLAVGAVGAAVALRGGPWEERTANQDPVAPAPESEPEAASGAPEAAPRAHHWVLGTAEEPAASVAALVLRGGADGAVALFLPLAALPLHGGFVDERGAPLGVKVLTHSLEGGFALLTPDRPPPADVEALDAAASSGLAAGTVLDVHAPDGQRAAVRLAGRSPDGQRLQLERELPEAAVLTAGGPAVAYAVEGRSAITLDRALPWLGRTGTRNLAGVQHELREWSPAHLRSQIEELLGPAASADDLRRAAALLERLALRARGDGLDELDRALRGTHLRLVRLLADSDPAEALAAARAALARFPADAGLLADGVVLCLRSDDLRDAAALYRQLAAVSEAHAERLAEAVAAALRGAAEDRLAEQRVGEAVDLLADAVRLFPRRADLQAGLARALTAAGQPDAALAAAETAARLDPAFAAAVEGYREAAELAREPGGLVEIPLDRRTGTIRAEVRVGGEPIELVVDTGATLTTLPTALVRRLGLWRPDLPKVQVTTASGVVEAPVVRIPEMTIGTLRVTRIKAVALDLPGSLAGKGLLGLNVLERLNMRLDSARGRLLLERRRR